MTAQRDLAPCRQRRSSPAAIAATLAVVLLAGCSEPAGVAEDKSAPAAVSPAAAETADASSQTIGGDGSAIVLTPLTPPEIEDAMLPGELVCGFAAPASPPLLVAAGHVASKDAAIGVVKVGDYVERVAAPGGFDAMLKGATFTGAGKTIRITLTGPATGGGESPPRPATLTYDRADGAKRTFTGLWTCGP